MTRNIGANAESKDAPLPSDKQDLETLYRLAKVVHSFTELQPLLENLVDLAIQHVNAERGVIFLKDYQGDLNSTAARSLYPEDLVDAQKVALSMVQASIAEEEGVIREFEFPLF